MKIAKLLFAYNRYEHTKNVLDGIKQCGITDDIFIFLDGPKNEKCREEVENVRQLLEKINWCNPKYTFRNENIGLAESIIQGVTSVFNQGYDAVIVLEDDCIPRIDFFEKMSKMLSYYKDDNGVMHVSGFGLPIKKRTDNDVYFTPYPCSWGWGTWRDVWVKCNFYQNENYRKLLKNKEEVRKFNYSGEAFSHFLELQIQGKVNSWLIRWYYYIFQNDGRCVWCYDSLIENKGFDGTGEHKVKFDWFNQKNNELNKSEHFLLENNKNYNQQIIIESRRFFKGNGILEKIKTIIYISTGIILERNRLGK